MQSEEARLSVIWDLQGISIFSQYVYVIFCRETRKYVPEYSAKLRNLISHVQHVLREHV